MCQKIYSSSWEWNLDCNLPGVDDLSLLFGHCCGEMLCYHLLLRRVWGSFPLDAADDGSGLFFLLELLLTL